MTASEDGFKGTALHSWKEIAACLGVTVRSAQRWEQTGGLPVYRQGSGKKARVFAYVEELERWRAAAGAASISDASGATPADAPAEVAPAAAHSPEPQTAAPVMAAPGRRLFTPFRGTLLLVAAAVGIWRLGIVPLTLEPAEWAVTGSRLAVMDSKGRLIWEKRFPHLAPDYENQRIEKVLIHDVDGDGYREVLFNHVPADIAGSGGSLMCFDARGRLRWETQYGAPKVFAGRRFAKSYRGHVVRPVRVRDRRLVLTVANHYLWYPSQAALLDPATGRVVEEYWHPGVLSSCVVQDLDGDGTEEVLLGGINNPGDGLGHAALAALKLPFSAAGKVAPHGKLPAFTGGGEWAYLLFPMPDVARVLGMLPIPSRLEVDRDRRVIFQTPFPEGGGIVYRLDFRLQVVECRFADTFAPLHHRLHRQGLIDHALTTRETEALGRVMRLPAAPDGNNPELEQFWRY